MSLYQPLNYDEQVELFRVLLDKHGIQSEVDEIRSLIACTNFDNLKLYMEDVGIFIKQDPIGVSISISSISSDKKWATNKLKLFWQYFIEDIK